MTSLCRLCSFTVNAYNDDSLVQSMHAHYLKCHKIAWGLWRAGVLADDLRTISPDAVQVDGWLILPHVPYRRDVM